QHPKLAEQIFPTAGRRHSGRPSPAGLRKQYLSLEPAFPETKAIPPPSTVAEQPARRAASPRRATARTARLARLRSSAADRKWPALRAKTSCVDIAGKSKSHSSN